MMVANKSSPYTLLTVPEGETEADDTAKMNK